MRPILAVLLALAISGQSGIAWAKSEADESTAEQIAAGTGAVLGSAVYFPFKASFCILSAVASGFTLPFEGTKSANEVASAGCRGTWAITPDIVKGKEQIKFVGEPPPSR